SGVNQHLAALPEVRGWNVVEIEDVVYINVPLVSATFAEHFEVQFGELLHVSNGPGTQMDAVPQEGDQTSADRAIRGCFEKTAGTSTQAKHYYEVIVGLEPLVEVAGFGFSSKYGLRSVDTAYPPKPSRQRSHCGRDYEINRRQRMVLPEIVD